MDTKAALKITLLLLAIFLVVSGCARPGDPGVPSPSEPAAIPGQADVSQPTSVMKEVAATVEPTVADAPRRGPGSFDLTSPGRGLEALNSYNQSLEIRSEGQAGSASKYLTHTVVRDPAGEMSTLETTDQNGAPVSISYARIGKTYFLKAGQETPCQTLNDESLALEFRQPDLANLLPLVYGAEEVGPDAVNGVPATRYDFDQRALPRYREVQASGSLWMAEGGWLVRYTLQVEGSAGSEAWNYEVTEANSLSQVELPEGCRPALTTIQVPEGAQSVVRMPGVLSFLTTDTPEAVTSFYQQAFEAQGWQQFDVFDSEGDENVLIFRSQEGTLQRTAAIRMTPAEVGLEVMVTVLEKEVELQPTPTP